MIRRFSEWLASFANKKFILPLLAAFIVGQGIFAHAGARLNELAGSEVQVLDFQPFHTSEGAVETLTKMGEDGRAYYREVLITWDFILPVLFALFFTLVWSYVLRRRRNLMPLNLVPIAATLVDFGENAFILDMIAGYPEVAYPGVLTGIKMIGIFFSFVGGGLALGLWIRDRFLAKRVKIIAVADN